MESAMQRRRSTISADWKKKKRGESIDAAPAGHQINERGLARQGYDLQATTSSSRAKTSRGGRPTFYTTGMEHSPTSATERGGSERPGTRRSGRRGRRPRRLAANN